jgi:hypothetical protein
MSLVGEPHLDIGGAAPVPGTRHRRTGSERLGHGTDRYRLVPTSRRAANSTRIHPRFSEQMC